MSRFKKIVLRSFILSFSLILTLGILEILVRTFFSSQVPPKNEWKESYVSLNSLGFRDREHTVEKPDNTFRIMILGDSLAYGTWINEYENIFPHKLEKFLNEGLEQPRFEVLNFSDPGGWRTGDQMYFLINEGIHYQPDLVLIAFSPNDIPPPQHYDEKSKKNIALSRFQDKVIEKLVDNFYIFNILLREKKALWVRLGYSQYYLDLLADRYRNRGWEMQKIYFDYINIFSRIHKIHLSIGIIPYAIQLGDDYPLLPGNSKIMNYCRSRNLVCVDIFNNGFKNQDPASFVTFPRDLHFNEKGHELSARAIYKKLDSLKKYKNLSRFHRAFNFTELIYEQWFVEHLDKIFEQIQPNGSPFIFKDPGSKKQELKVWRDWENLHLQRIYMDKAFPEREVRDTIVLTYKGEFVRRNKEMIDQKTGVTTKLKNHYNLNGKYTLIETKNETKSAFPEVIFPGNKKENIFSVLRQTPKTFTFGPIISLADPLILERKIFRDEFVLFGKRDSEENWFELLNSFYSWPKYFKSLVTEVMKRPPNQEFLNALKRTYDIRQDKEKLNLLIKNYPSLNNAFSSQKPRP